MAIIDLVVAIAIIAVVVAPGVVFGNWITKKLEDRKSEKGE